MESYIIQTKERSTIAAIKPLLKKLKIEIKKVDLPYNPIFVDKIEQGEIDLKDGKGIKMSIDDFMELCK
jgi:hypothetical protein